MQADREVKFMQVLAKAWAALHMKAPCGAPMALCMRNEEYCTFGLLCILRMGQRGTKQKVKAMQAKIPAAWRDGSHGRTGWPSFARR